jgi:uncharacterized damage-inducible protein DinB
MSTRSPIEDALAHHVWATLVIIDTCSALSPEQLETNVPGTFGSIIDTVRHTVGADSWYLFRLSGQRHPTIDEDGMGLAELRKAMEDIGQGWLEVLAQPFDPDEMVVAVRDDGGETHAPKGMRIAQVLHHGTDHRSQICTALTTLGIEPPEVDAWAWGQQTGRVVEVPPTS